MESERHVTAVLLMATLAAVGCSKKAETARATSSTTGAEGVKPVSLPSVLSKKSDGMPSGTAPAAVVPPATFADGKTAYDARKYREAVTIFELYTGRRPDNAWGHYMLGLSAWKNGDLTKAESALEQALRIDPRHVKSYVNLSRVLIDLKRTDDALMKLTSAADIDPNSTEVYRLLGRTYQSQRRIDEAVAAYRQAIELDGFDAWSMNNLALIFLETERPEEALPLLARAVELRKDVPAFHNNLGMALEHTGRFKAAAAAYAGALTADPGYGNAKQNLARVEGVRSDGEEPFDAAAAAAAVGKNAEEKKIATDVKTASK
jgi:tetratricopeptide (TPR) repeat protein